MKPSLTKVAYTLVLLLMMGYALFALHGSIPSLVDKQRQIRELEKRNTALAQDIEHKRERIERLRDSESEQELEIRQRLKLVRPGEKVFVLQDQDKKTPGPR